MDTNMDTFLKEPDHARKLRTPLVMGALDIVPNVTCGYRISSNERRPLIKAALIWKSGVH